MVRFADLPRQIGKSNRNPSSTIMIFLNLVLLHVIEHVLNRVLVIILRPNSGLAMGRYAISSLYFIHTIQIRQATSVQLWLPTNIAGVDQSIPVSLQHMHAHPYVMNCHYVYIFHRGNLCQHRMTTSSISIDTVHAICIPGARLW
jgi:hypothetical protein